MCTAVQLDARPHTEANLALEEAVASTRAALDNGAELVVLPEGTWPAYYLGDMACHTWPWPALAEALSPFQDLARAYQAVIVTGLMEPAPGGVYNAAYVIDRDGSSSRAAAKRFLWDFESRWTVRETSSTPVDTSLGKLGVLICADARAPEIARQLTLHGAEVLLDPTAWVTGEPDPTKRTNPQYEHLLGTRALENGLWAIAANKVGIERETIVYCGRSTIVDAMGLHQVSAPPDQPDRITAEVPFGPATPPAVRKPKLYQMLGMPTHSTPAAEFLESPDIPRDLMRRVVVGHSGSTTDETVTTAVELGADLIISAQHTLPAEPEHHESFPATVTVAPGTARYNDGEQTVVWTSVHDDSTPEAGSVAPTSLGRVTVLFGDDILLPEPARVLMLQGADVILWADAQAEYYQVAATRALENRLYVIALPRLQTGAAAVFNPAGNQVGKSALGQTFTYVTLNLAESRQKQMAPGTDVLWGRQPEHYTNLYTEL